MNDAIPKELKHLIDLPEEVTKALDEISEEDMRVINLKMTMLGFIEVRTDKPDDWVEHVGMDLVRTMAFFHHGGAMHEFFPYAVDCILIAPDDELRQAIRDGADMAFKALFMELTGYSTHLDDMYKAVVKAGEDMKAEDPDSFDKGIGELAMEQLLKHGKE